jgi:hypothetical protein
VYKFIIVKGSCGSGYDVGTCEKNANEMYEKGYDLVQVYQSTTSQCCGGAKSILVMVFKKRA